MITEHIRLSDISTSDTFFGNHLNIYSLVNYSILLSWFFNNNKFLNIFFLFRELRKQKSHQATADYFGHKFGQRIGRLAVIRNSSQRDKYFNKDNIRQVGVKRLKQGENIHLENVFYHR